MINNAQIKECFQCLVGWKESASAGTCYEELTDNLKHSDSGIYVNDLPAVKLEIINEMLGKDQNIVNNYLTELYSDSSIKVVRSFITAHKKNNYAKAILENYDLGIYAQNIRRSETKRDRFVGFEIIPHSGNSVNAQVMQIGGMFSATQQTLPIYFYSSKQADPLLTFNATITKANSLVWFDLSVVASGSGSTSDSCDTLVEIIAKSINADSGSNARYYIGYYETDLDANNYSISTQSSCLSCGSRAKKMNAYATVRPIEVTSGNIYNDATLFDLTSVGYTTSTYGLHIKLNVTCDISQIICDNKMLFAEAQRLQQAITILWDCYNSTALNRIMASKKEDFRLMAEKYESDLAEVLKSLTIDFSNVDPICVGSKKAVFGLMNM